MFLKHPAAPRTNTACHNLSLHDALPCSADLVLTDPAIGDFRTFARLSPPLRSEDDRHACLAAIEDGTIDILSSGHDPRGPEDKRLPFAEALPGMAGAETLLALGLNLVRDGHISTAERSVGKVGVSTCRSRGSTYK